MFKRAATIATAGNNYYAGTGIVGRVQTSGHQKSYIDDWAGESYYTYLKVHADREQICRTLGLLPIDDRVRQAMIHDDGRAERGVL